MTIFDQILDFVILSGSYKNWKFQDIIIDIRKAYHAGQVIISYNDQGLMNGVLIYNFNLAGKVHITQCVTNRSEGALRFLIRKLISEFPHDTSATALRKEGTKLVIYNKQQILKHV